MKEIIENCVICVTCLPNFLRCQTMTAIRPMIISTRTTMITNKIVTISFLGHGHTQPVKKSKKLVVIISV